VRHICCTHNSSTHSHSNTGHSQHAEHLERGFQRSTNSGQQQCRQQPPKNHTQPHATNDSRHRRAAHTQASSKGSTCEAWVALHFHSGALVVQSCSAADKCPDHNRPTKTTCSPGIWLPRNVKLHDQDRSTGFYAAQSALVESMDTNRKLQNKAHMHLTRATSGWLCCSKDQPK